MNTSFSASKDFNVNLKHVRREFEPELKAAGDHMLSAPWSDLDTLSKDAQFALSEVMHLSHATHVQQQVIPKFTQEGNSCIVEAKTGSGKTLAFIVPLTERFRNYNNSFIANHNYPFLSRNICAFIVSPSRVLAQQTFIVGRNYSCRYPFSVKYILVDKHVEALEKTAVRLSRVARGGGFIIVGTVSDVHGLNEILASDKFSTLLSENEAFGGDKVSAFGKHHQNQADDDSDDDEEEEEDDEFDDDPELKKLMQERRQQMKEKAKQQKQQQQQNNNNNNSKKPQGKKGNKKTTTKNDSNNATSNQQDAFEKPIFAPFPTSHRFTVIVDEADVVLKDLTSYSQLFSLCQSIKEQTVKQQNASRKGKEDNVDFDFGLFGATATSVTQVNDFMSDFKKKVSKTTKLNTFTLSTQLEADAADLRNLYEMVEPQHILESFIHILNMHHSKKHFVFFNNIAVLNFVHRLLVKLSRGTRPVLRTSTIFGLHEGMKDSVRFEQFGKFVRYSGDEQRQIAKDKKLGVGGKAGWGDTAKKVDKKLESRSTANALASSVSTGAILLCTDEAAFGLDVRDVDYVIHFEPPTSIQSFIHRSGRVARMGMTGTSILLLPSTPEAKEFLLRVNAKLAEQHQKNRQQQQKISGNSNNNNNEDDSNNNNNKTEAFIHKLHINGARAPIAANVAAFVEEIATDAEAHEKQNIVTMSCSISLPSRRSRHVEEQIELQAKMNQHHKHGGSSEVVSQAAKNKESNKNNRNDDDEGSAGNEDDGSCKSMGTKLVSLALKAMEQSEVYSKEGAAACIFSRY